MKYRTTGVLALLVAVGVLAGTAWSQPPGGPRGMHGGRGGRPERRMPQGQQPGYQTSVNLLIMALNANGDSEISESEIKNASASLKTLDRNNDGRLTIDEVMPGGPQAFGGPGQGGFAGQRRGRGRPDGGFENGVGPGGPGQGGPDGPGRGPIEHLVEQCRRLTLQK